MARVARPTRWLLGLLLAAPPVFAQEPTVENPVFADESPATLQGLDRVREYLAARNDDQAVRLIQKLLDEQGDGVVGVAGDAVLYEPVRARVHAILLGTPTLLAKYREVMGARAGEMLRAGGVDQVERTRFLTPAGLEAALAITRRRLLAGQIDGAVMMVSPVSNHPDRAARAEAVAAVVKQVAEYANDPRDRALLAALIDGDLPPARFTHPPATATLRTGVPDARPGALADVTPAPLGTGVFDLESLPIRPLNWSGGEDAMAQLPRFMRGLRNWPAVSSKVVVINQGASVVAFDRVTLRELWRRDVVRELGKETPEPESRGIMGGVRTPMNYEWEEVVEPTLVDGGHTVLAVVAQDTDRASTGEGEEYLVNLAASTGEIRWVRKVTDLDAQLVRSTTRGPIVSDGRVAVLSLLKRQPERRLMAAILVGVDVLTGERAWTRVVGSVGALPFWGQSQTADMAAADRGVVYRSDRLGVMGAYAIADGRPLWVRRLGSKVFVEAKQLTPPWLVHGPVPTEAGVFVLSPERDRVLLLDASTGSEIASRAATDLKEPLYLTRCGAYLVAVSERQVATVRVDQFASGEVRATGLIGPVGIGPRGRVSVAGDSIVVPTTTGLMVLEPSNPNASPRMIALDHPGAALALPEGLLTADDVSLHMYSTWSVASAHLRSQIDAAPGDPGPATELLALADRVGQTGELLPAGEMVASALGRAEQSGASPTDVSRHRSRAVETLLGVAARSVRDATTNGGVRLDAVGIDRALELAAGMARSGRERAATRLVHGRVDERRGKAADAAEAYQSVLLDPTMAEAPVVIDGAGGSTRADAEALNRLRAMMATSGRSCYAAFDAAFEQRLRESPVETLGALYPMARALPGAWLASAAKRQGDKAQARALEMGVQAAERIGDAPPEIVGELNGRLITNLLGRGLTIAAGDAFTRATARFPNIALSDGTTGIDMAALRARLATDLASARRWPRVGVPLGEPKPQVFEGWALMEPLIPNASGAAPAFFVMLRGDDRRSQVALMGFPTGARANEAASSTAAALTELWSSPLSDKPWQLLRLDGRGATFIIGDERGASLARVDAASQKVTWQTPAFGTLFPDDPPLRFGPVEPGMKPMMPGGFGPDGFSSPTELLAATDDRTMVLAERSGRAAAFDTDSGQMLWASSLPLARVTDMDVVGGQIIAAGEASPNTLPKGVLDRVALVDARSGRSAGVCVSPVSNVKWVRVTSRGDLILGGRGNPLALAAREASPAALACVAAPDIETGKAAWIIKNHPSASAAEAWLVDDRLFVMNDERSMYEIDVTTGAPPTQVLDTHGRLEAHSGIAAVWTGPTEAGGGGSVAFATGKGVFVVAPGGRTVGADAVNASESSVTPIAVEGGFVIVASGTPMREQFGGLGDGGGSYVIHRVNNRDASLVSSTPITLGLRPQRVAAIDGRIAITAGMSTSVFVTGEK